TATGTGTLTYQWRKGRVPVPGANSDTLMFDPFAESDYGTYACVITDDCGVVTTRSVTISRGTPLTIDTQPQDTSACAGFDAVFTVSASGDDLSYQWRKGCTVIDGADEATLVIENVQAGDVGEYLCVVWNDCGSLTSQTAELTISPGILSFKQQPADSIACRDDDVTLSVFAVGTAPITYQWEKDGVPIPGETERTLTLTDIDDDDEAEYACVASNICGNLRSEVVSASLAVDCEDETPDDDLRDSLTNGQWSDGMGGTFDIDANDDGLISTEEAEAVTGILDLSGQGIEDLTGLDAFSNITGLDASDNDLSQWPDLSGFPNLVTLDLSGNGLPDLTRRGVGALAVTLEEIYLDNNRLSTLPDLTGLDVLRILSASFNRLQSIQSVLDQNGIGSSAGDRVSVQHNLLLSSGDNCAVVQDMLNRTANAGSTFNYSPQRDYSSLPAWAADVDVLDLIDNLVVPLNCTAVPKRSARR
ncbi:MAG: immunoglobulin domain-containing protein, partial [Acidobacteriota bacterium]|nr:immunoglobulin domain-containing protein [Acidobacteriota bacterium]